MNLHEYANWKQLYLHVQFQTQPLTTHPSLYCTITMGGKNTLMKMSKFSGLMFPVAMLYPLNVQRCRANVVASLSELIRSPAPKQFDTKVYQEALSLLY